ncbi:hypothetical protein ACTUVK_002493 [Stenotrophomonas rhizophila]
MSDGDAIALVELPDHWGNRFGEALLRCQNAPPEVLYFSVSDHKHGREKAPAAIGRLKGHNDFDPDARGFSTRHVELRGRPPLVAHQFVLR